MFKILLEWIIASCHHKVTSWANILEYQMEELTEWQKSINDTIGCIIFYFELSLLINWFNVE